eukprot:scaffold38735_cov69-Phaeocystis_antarctica.AAC.4
MGSAKSRRLASYSSTCCRDHLLPRLHSGHGAAVWHHQLCLRGARKAALAAQRAVALHHAH